MDSSHAPSCSDALPGERFVWRDLAWRDRAPVAVVEPLRDGRPSGERVTIPLLGDARAGGAGSDAARPVDSPTAVARPGGLLLGATPLPPEDPEAGLWCSGFAHAYLDEDGEPRFRGVDCPKAHRIERGQQCPLCLHLDRFRPIHGAHRGAELSEAVRAYVARPHWLYVATFPDGASKVGTAHERSKTSRLDQQAVARASYVALADDGLVVRRLEDACTRELALPQAKRVATKFRAWCAPLPSAELDRIHDELAGRARGLLAELGGSAGAAGSVGLTGAPAGHRVADERWTPSEAMRRAYAALRAESPEPLSAADPFGTGLPGAKGAARDGGSPYAFRVTGGTGPFLTGALDGDAGPSLLVSTAGLKNRACRWVEDSGQATGTQRSLF